MIRLPGRTIWRRLCVAAGTLLALAIAADSISFAETAKDKAADKLTFADDILPIFRVKCIRCHAGVEPKGGLNLTQPSSLLSGGKSGAAIRIAAAEFSLLYEKISSDEMPAVGQKLTAEEKGIIRTWINEGATGVSNADSLDASGDQNETELWSFNPPRRPAIPQANPSERVRNPIDAFVLHRLQQKGLAFAPEASRRTLLRRASFDLLGLPPAPDEIEQFVTDDRPGAYERMIERLLASPHYGERWARHWLDVAGYADSAGILSEDRQLPLLWRYRDYVIRAFNNDKPYDRFLLEQIAGDELTDYWTAYETLDELPAEVVEGITATGFLRTAADPSRPDFSTIKNAHAQYYYPTMFDTLQIVCSSTMGLTIQCARCHSHKFDPIPQVDYYRMQSLFMSAYRPDAWVPQMNRRLKVATKKQEAAAKKRNAEIDEAVKKLQAQLADSKKEVAEKLFAERLSKLPDDIRPGVEAAFATADKTRTQEQKTLVEKFRKQLRPEGKELDEALNTAYPDHQKKSAELTAKIAAENRQRIAFDEIRALYDLQGTPTTPVLLRGDPLTPGPSVQPGVISTVSAPQAFDWTAPAEATRSSGRRLAFGRWLTQAEHPLTARVMVNRIWLHHFGRGIVATPEDFGVSGAPPTHPALLDWLATEFVRSGWSVKHVHRLILTSSTWRQCSQVDQDHRAACEPVDADNALLWRQAMRRLDAEPMRDAILFTAGTASRVLYGPPVPVQRAASGEASIPLGHGENRRSIYVIVMRLRPETMLDLFDQPKISVNCTQRSVSTVSTQALTLLNSETMVRAAHAFADRVLSNGESDPVGYAVAVAFSRACDNEERELLSAFLVEQTERYLSESAAETRDQAETVNKARRRALADLCHMLLSANEFAYVD